jgi:hypothetical protein
VADFIVPVQLKICIQDIDEDESDFWIALNDCIEEKNNSQSKQNRIE